MHTLAHGKRNGKSAAIPCTFKQRGEVTWFSFHRSDYFLGGGAHSRLVEIRWVNHILMCELNPRPVGCIRPALRVASIRGRAARRLRRSEPGSRLAKVG